MIIHAKHITVYGTCPFDTMFNRHVHPAISIDLLTQGIDVLICPALLYAVCNKAGEVEEKSVLYCALCVSRSHVFKYQFHVVYAKAT